MKARLQILFFVVLVFVATFTLLPQQTPRTVQRVDITEAIRRIDAGEAASAILDRGEVRLELKNGSSLRAYAPADSDLLLSALSEANVPARYSRDAARTSFDVALVLLLGLVILIALVAAVRRKVVVLSDTSRHLRRASLSLKGPRLSSVCGLPEVVSELSALLDALHAARTQPQTQTTFPRSLLLIGPSGSGKTLLARALATEAKVPFFYVDAVQLIEEYVGHGRRRMQEIFDLARRKPPSLLFLDNLEALAQKRGVQQGTASAFQQLLSELDALPRGPYMAVVAATSRPELFADSLLNDTCFERTLELTLPDPLGREAILTARLKALPQLSGISLSELVARTDGFSGAALERLIQLALHLARRRQGAPDPAVTPAVDHTDMERAFQLLNARQPAPLDILLARAADGMAVPTGSLELCLKLIDGRRLEGQVRWMDPTQICLELEGGPVVLTRQHILSLQPAQAGRSPMA